MKDKTKLQILKYLFLVRKVDTLKDGNIKARIVYFNPLIIVAVILLMLYHMILALIDCIIETVVQFSNKNNVIYYNKEDWYLKNK